MIDNIECAVNAFCESNYIPLNLAENEILCYNNPEMIYEKKDSFNHLSAEAKEVIKIVLNAPTELSELFSTNGERVSKDNLKQYLRRTKRWKHRVIDEVFKEIKGYVNSFGG